MTIEFDEKTSRQDGTSRRNFLGASLSGFAFAAFVGCAGQQTTEISSRDDLENEVRACVEKCCDSFDCWSNNGVFSVSEEFERVREQLHECQQSDDLATMLESLDSCSALLAEGRSETMRRAFKTEFAETLRALRDVIAVPERIAQSLEGRERSAFEKLQGDVAQIPNLYF